MTDRISAITVVLDKDIREDDAAPLVEAFKHFAGVIDVRPEVSGDLGIHIAESRARAKLIDEMRDILYGR